MTTSKVRDIAPVLPVPCYLAVATSSTLLSTSLYNWQGSSCLGCRRIWQCWQAPRKGMFGNYFQRVRFCLSNKACHWSWEKEENEWCVFHVSNWWYHIDGLSEDTNEDLVFGHYARPWWSAGRVDDVINVSGHRVGTAEVESALQSHDQVIEAAVVGCVLRPHGYIMTAH